MEKAFLRYDAERTYEEGTEALHSRREGSHFEAAPFGQGARLGFVSETGLAAVGRALQQHRLNSAIGYVTPKLMLAARQQELHGEQHREVGGSAAAPTPSPASGVTDEGTLALLQRAS